MFNIKETFKKGDDSNLIDLVSEFIKCALLKS